MALQPAPSVGTIFSSTWQGVRDVLVGLPLLCLAGFLIYLGAEILPLAVPAIAGNTVLSEALDATRTILIIPLEIAIYRLLIRGEASPGYVSKIFAPRFHRLLQWTVALWALITFPHYLVRATTQSEDAETIAVIVTTIVLIIIVVRLIVLFPAIAVDAPHASMRNALADTKGRSWLILKSMLMAMLLPLAVLLAIALTSELEGSPFWWSSVKILFDSALEFLLTVMATVTAARLYDWIGSEVKGGPNSTSA